MILMGLASMVMFVGMPKLMDNSTSLSHSSRIRKAILTPVLVDPEMKAEFEARQAQGPLASLMGGGGGGGGGGNAQDANPLGNFDMASYLAGSGKKEGGNGGNGASSKSQGVRR
jgi:hypothetical protein